MILSNFRFQKKTAKCSLNTLQVKGGKNSDFLLIKILVVHKKKNNIIRWKWSIENCSANVLPKPNTRLRIKQKRFDDDCLLWESVTMFCPFESVTMFCPLLNVYLFSMMTIIIILIWTKTSLICFNLISSPI